MSTLLLSWLLVSGAVLEASPLEPGTLLTYRGQIVASQGEEAATRKQIELTFFVAESSDKGTTLWWSLAEQGRGGFGWTDQFGRLELDARLRMPAGAMGPALLYDREEGMSVVPMNLPFLVGPEPLAKELKWEEGGWQYSVEGNEAVGDRQAWQVKVGNRFGRRRNWLVDSASPRILKLREIVFMGQGQEHILTLELASSEKLAADAAQKVATAFTNLAQLRDTLVPQRRSAEIQWNKEKVEQLKGALPPIASAAAATIVERLVSLAQLDARFQSGRNGAVAALQASMIGKPLGEFALEDLERVKVDQATLKNQVTVLHFWDYKETPLEAPYGQVGYLDFLYRKRKGDGVLVYGVAVNSGPNDDDTRRKNRTSARKIREFMNASFPVLLDNGTLIRRLGDPRETGAKLPLFVVIGRDGKISEYHVGLYETGRDQGLTQLDAAVKAALEKRE